MEIKWPKITFETPIEEIHRIHKDIWQYVIDHGDKPDTPYTHDCVLCEYAMCCQERTFGVQCAYCPVDWGSMDNMCSSVGSPYYRWHLAKHLPYDEIKAKLEAEQIRDIPFKYEIKRKGTDELA